MAKVKGICKNIDNCDKAENKEIQEVEKSAPFICQECGKPLVSGGTTPPPATPKWIFLVVAIVVLAGAGGSYFYFSQGSEESADIVETAYTSEETITENTIEETSDTASATLQSCLNEGTLIDNNDGTGSISTPYGKYEGDLKDGKANGNGSFQFFKTCRISSRDNQERSGETGDYLVGQFAGNDVISAKWLNKEKEQKGTIIIGQSGV